MLQITLNSDSISICVLDNDSSTLRTTSQLLSSAGWPVRPFSHPDTFIDYVRTHRPKAAIVDFGGPRANGLEVAARVREVSPVTSVIISLKVHRAGACNLLSRNELVSLLEQHCSED